MVEVTFPTKGQNKDLKVEKKLGRHSPHQVVKVSLPSDRVGPPCAPWCDKDSLTCCVPACQRLTARIPWWETRDEPQWRSWPAEWMWHFTLRN